MPKATSEISPLTEKEKSLFWEKVDKFGPIPKHAQELGPCWIWTGAKMTKGYGVSGGVGKRKSAHRTSYFINYGVIPSGMFVLHKCDNPPCVNPNHLFIGTQADNMADMKAKGRIALGESHGSKNTLKKCCGENQYPVQNLLIQRCVKYEQRYFLELREFDWHLVWGCRL